MSEKYESSEPEISEELSKELENLEPGKTVTIGDSSYYKIIPPTPHEHEFEEIEPGMWLCKHCPQGRIGHLC